MADSRLPQATDKLAAHMAGLSRFHVRVGLAECTVLCQTPEEAVRLARSKIGQEMPKVRSVLHNIHDKEFRVDRVD